MVDLRQVEDLDRLNIIHVTGTKGKVRRAGGARGAWGGEGRLPASLPQFPFALAWATCRG